MKASETIEYETLLCPYKAPISSPLCPSLSIKHSSATVSNPFERRRGHYLRLRRNSDFLAMKFNISSLSPTSLLSSSMLHLISASDFSISPAQRRYGEAVASPPALALESFRRERSFLGVLLQSILFVFFLFHSHMTK
ncbi:hypothetical protein CsSME_00040140 [Camellia sinensis var. sinensis]